ncbi:MAG: helix-hairpin-helix domain-containing protein [Sporichthyaceae bacterium]
MRIRGRVRGQNEADGRSDAVSARWNVLWSGASGQGVGSPGQGVGSPGQGASPGQGVGSPGQGAGSPGQGVGSPGQGAGSPGQGAGSPGQGAGSPGQGAGSPGQGADPPVPVTPLRIGILTRARFALDLRALGALLVVALLGVAFAVVVLLRSRPAVLEVGPARVQATGLPLSGAVTSLAPSLGVSPERIVVDVQGQVRRPGLVRIPAGSRVLDALRAAGGPRRGVATTSVNLARPLVDGEQIVLAAAPETAQAPDAGAAGTGLIDLNTADLAALDTLPGVGPVLAQRILDFRARNGRFTAVEELQEVPGIGPAIYASLRPKVRI